MYFERTEFYRGIALCPLALPSLDVRRGRGPRRPKQQETARTPSPEK